MQGQQFLDQFNLQPLGGQPSAPQQPTASGSNTIDLTHSSDEEEEEEENAESEPETAMDKELAEIWHRECSPGAHGSMELDFDADSSTAMDRELAEVWFNEHSPPPQSSSEPRSSGQSPAATRPATPGPDADRGFDEDWEEELDEQLHGQKFTDILSWDGVKEIIDFDLREAKKKHLPLAQVNQLLLIRNFCILMNKGFSRIEASVQIALQWHTGEGVHFARRVRILVRHYEVFRALPRECRGGARDSRSYLSEESVHSAARTWLEAQPAGSVKPKTFLYALNTDILPSVGIKTNKGLCERTARRWLIKLGWRLTVLKKGVYMDGHERDDVVQ
jgi:hypothetical protein